ncbi:hypothetical protein KSP39_PZI012504 [Platanthera zijinensis]|uniref:Uncharacterized protein n=1 Tax=Platanthera zijinensis TaxID=2320716 RepID=A0AAP0BFS2_9ASPA
MTSISQAGEILCVVLFVGAVAHYTMLHGFTQRSSSDSPRDYTENLLKRTSYNPKSPFIRPFQPTAPQVRPLPAPLAVLPQSVLPSRTASHHISPEPHSTTTIQSLLCPPTDHYNLPIAWNFPLLPPTTTSTAACMLEVACNENKDFDSGARGIANGRILVMNVERLQKMAGAVRTGGKGSMRRCSRDIRKVRTVVLQRMIGLHGFERLVNDGWSQQVLVGSSAQEDNHSVGDQYGCDHFQSAETTDEKQKASTLSASITIAAILRAFIVPEAAVLAAWLATGERKCLDEHFRAGQLPGRRSYARILLGSGGGKPCA